MIDERQMTLGQDWERQDIAGWLVSEKLDGVRVYWDGCNFWTRAGLRVLAPRWFTAGLDSEEFDGEIWAGRGQLAAATAAVTHGRFTSAHSFQIFDAPWRAGTWAERMACVQTSDYARPVEYWRTPGPEQLRADYARITALGGEGLMLRDPAPRSYRRGRTASLLKVKYAHQFAWIDAGRAAS